jgi:uncharacterized protein YndB with AHSA1/START domain
VFTVVASVSLPYSPEAVYAAVASVEGTVRWQAGVRGVWRARPSASPPPLVLHYWALGVRHRLHARVTAHVPPERFAYRAEGDGIALDVTYGVAPTRHGCHVACTVILRGADPAAPAAAPAPAQADLVRLRRLLTRRLPRDLARLEAWVAVQPGARLGTATEVAV